MKRNPRLGALENLSVVGLVAGSIASLVSKQILYTTMPMSLLVVLDLLSRRRFEDNSRQRDLSLAETDQKLAIQVDLLNQHIASLPSVETINGLRQGLLMKDREVARRLYAEITALQQEMHQRLHPLEQQGLDSVRQDMTQLEARHQQMSEDLAAMGIDLRQTKAAIDPAFTEAAIAHLQSDMAGIQATMESLTSQHKPNFSSLQEQISRIDRQFGKLPPPVDLSSLKQEVGELVRMISDLVPRRDLLSLVKEVRELHQQQEWLKQSVVAIETAAVSFNSAFSNLIKPSGAAGSENGANLSHPILSGQLDRDIAQRQVFQSAATPADASAIQEEAAHYLEHLRSQLAEIQSFTETLAAQNQQLQEQMNHLPKSLDMAALQSQLRELSRRIPAAETTLDDFRGRIQEVIQQELHYISQQLQGATPSYDPNYKPNYELVFDWAPASETSGVGSCTLLEEALNCTQKRLILILPWASSCNLDQTILKKMAAFLQQGRRLDIGWCNEVDRQDDRLLKKMQRGWQPSSPQADIQTTLHHLLNFKRAYPQNFQFKILGTRESFLVSDQSFAVLGIADALKTTTALSEAQLKLRTRDPQPIQRLVNRFDNPALDPEDWEAYWNRGATRQNLGDKTGAIADYTHVLEIAPEHALPYSHRGVAYYDVGDLASAIADLTEALRLDPQQAATYCNRAFIHSEQGNLQAAITDYTQAIQIRPDWAIAFFYRGMAWQKLDRHQDAISDYGEAIYLAPDSAVAHYYRGLAWQKLRNTQGAIADLEKAALLFNQYGSLQNAQKALRSLAKLRQISNRVRYSAATEAEEAIVRPGKTVREATRETVAPDFEAIASLFQGIPSEPQVNGCDFTGNPAVTAAPLTFQDLFDAENFDAERLDLETIETQKLEPPSPIASRISQSKI
ncbi:MAG: tetratricopeptide repeat protein [Drouetiella hepatica Uher 2000/2452]|jgi:tetratricopeptide (TPR) repeat protein/aryl carrier-like protein|uniref:Tetratricopeptide repeat protein n=1 Tax=Drouetiella hepatica Uher 2000/2452 TaxID=904376 RepID=A0A951UL51_9CYAN|nr:tetratricopeptide repeat protein [Drouetiella hepatica Uher 2000/2452]